MKISDLVNRVEPFRFEYDGEVLEGEYYKYRTTTPKYLKDVLASVPEVPESGTNEDISAAKKARLEAQDRVNAKVLTDTIKSWNAQDEDGSSLPITQETFDQLPGPFLTLFVAFLSDLRGGAQEKRISALAKWLITDGDFGECPDYYWPLERAHIVAKYMRCSVRAALQLDDESFEQAFVVAIAQAKARPHIIEREAEKEKKRKKNG